MKKRFLGVLLVGAMVMSTVLTGCGNKKESKSGGEDKITIGFSSKTNSDTFVKAIADAAEDAAKEQGVDLIMADAEGDVNKQINDCETLIAQQLMR